MEYCERVGDAFWAEPLNALSNLAFLLAAAAAFNLLRRRAVPLWRCWDCYALGLLLAAIGVGSFLWHTLASRWTLLTDVLPITLFINLYLLSYLVRMTGLRWSGVAALFLLYQLVNVGVAALLPPGALNGSAGYLPAFVALLLMAVHQQCAGSAAGGNLFAATAVFALSLTLRTLDNALCPEWPAGLHWGWHLCNAVVLYLTIRGLSAGVGMQNADTGRQFAH